MGSGPPLVDIRRLGIWYRLHPRQPWLLKRALLRPFSSQRSPTFWALREVSLSAEEGLALAVVGANGAGKSTFCLALAGLLPPDEGSVEVRGRVTALLSLGAGLNADLSGRANVALQAALLGISRQEIERQLAEIVRFAELEEFIDQPVRAYSRGMRARLAFAIASTIEPEILVLDETLSVGDAAFQARSEARMKELMRKSRLIVVVSHAAPTLRSLCSHALWLDKGRMRAYGEAGSVLDAYNEHMAAQARLEEFSLVEPELPTGRTGDKSG